MAEVLAAFAAEGVKGRALEVSHAFHSHRLDPMLEPLERFAAGLTLAAPRIPIVSNLTGELMPVGVAPDAAYFRRHAREPVRFAAGIAALRAAGATALVEIGPHPTLLGLAARAQPGATWATAPSLRRGRDDGRELLSALATLQTRGAGVDWEAVQAGLPPARGRLPTYPFQRERHWATPGASPAQPRRAGPAGAHPLLGQRQEGPGPGARFLAEVSSTAPAFLAEHVVFGHVLLPGTAYLEVALAAARELGGGDELALEGVAIEAPLALPPGAVQLLHVSVEAEAGGRAGFQVRSAPQAGGPDRSWRLHAQGALRSRGLAGGPVLAGTVAEARARCTAAVDVEAYYTRLARAGLAYGPVFRGVRSLHTGRREAVGTLEVPPAEAGRWILHPALLDAAFHLLGLALAADRPGEPDRVYLPIGLEALRVSGAGAPPRVHAVARLREAPEAPTVFLADLRLEDDQGGEVAAITGLQLRPVELATLQQALAQQGVAARSFTVRWEEVRAAGPAAGPGRYLLVADQDGVADALAGALSAAGGQCTVLPASALEADGEAALAALLADGSPLAWAIDCSPLDAAAAGDLPGQLRAGYLRHLRLSRAVAAAAPRAGLGLLTRGAQAIAPGDEPALASAPLLGLARAVASERGEAPALRLDLDPAAAPDLRQLLVALGGLGRTGPELAVRSGTLLAPRLEEAAAAPPLPPRTREVLRLDGRGSLEVLRHVREPRRAPAAGEVEIEIRAAGINFRDVLNALGMIPGAPPHLGAECAGVVVGVGAGVEGLRPGDEVVALAVDSLATHVTASASMVLRKPAGVGFAQAVTVPNAFLTAAVSLLDVAEVRAGQRVLIHAAAGGVGLAALRLARRAGAEVIATAGSPEKRALVLAEGAAHAFDSRSASFEAEVLRVTDGAGVDCVLNSLAGKLIGAGLRVVRPGGCFVELGKQGIWTAAQAAERAPGVRYVVVDLGQDLARDPAPVRVRFEQLLRDLGSGELAPLPVRAYALRDAQAAFRTMAAGRHVGKLVLVPPGPAELPVRRDGAYLVTGGLGGIGLAAARWLAQQGAGELVLLGRRGPGPADEPALEALRAAGARVTALACDVGDEAAVGRLWREVLARGLPLRGIVHAAGVLADASLAEQDAARFDAVAAGKLGGALHLHAASARDPLDFFALFSSTSALLGSPGQANYAAANAVLDGLAAFRRARGLAATSIGWGAWGEVGMAARLSEAQRARWARIGLGLLHPDEAFPRLGRALAGSAPHVAILSLDPGLFAAQAGPAVRALLGTPAEAAAPAAPAAAKAAGPLPALRAASGGAERLALLRAYVHHESARVLGFNASALDPETPLSALGFDSLMAVQLRNRVEADLALKLPLAELLGGPTVSQLTAAIAARWEAAGDGAAPAAAEPTYEEGSL
ncbi:MAG: SDR family NAD(P)-dependent oxidoreductase [Anaeromyxobacter sp.]